MGKAARRGGERRALRREASGRIGGARARSGRADRAAAAGAPAQAPFVARPFEGLTDETEWVAMREILPAATAPVTLQDGRQATVATVLPLAWPALHRTGGDVLVATQSTTASSDASRDIAAALLAAFDEPEGTPVASLPLSTAATRPLQDVLDVAAPFEVTVHEGFDFWVSGTELDEEGAASLQRANDSIARTVRLPGARSAYWVELGDRAFVRWILPDDEADATDALARLQAAAASRIGEGTRLLGAFRACGLLVPVWDVDPKAPADAHAAGFAELVARYGEALATDTPLTAKERGARAGLVGRQVTIR